MSNLILLTAFFVVLSSAPEAPARSIVQNTGSLGIIKGVVRNEAGSPIADATVAIFRANTSRILKQVRSASDGSFFAKILPGTYSVLAVAQGFNPATFSEVEVSRSTELVYRFNLERSGSGNTLPEKVVDRNSSKSRIRAAQSQRSIYQNREGAPVIDENEVTEKTGTDSEDGENVENEEVSSNKQGQTVVETYFANNGGSTYKGVNFARLQPLNENAEIVFAGQFGTTGSAPQRFETSLNFRHSNNHKVHLNGAVSKIGQIKLKSTHESLGQISFQVLDEWKRQSGVIVVAGVDYSKFVGAGNDFSISPRLGLQFDINSKTRFRAAYTSAAEERSWQSVVDLEEAQVLFHEPISVPDLIFENNKPKMNKNRRLEFGVERVLSNKSSIEANAFFDSVNGRGVGLTNFSSNLDDANFGGFVSEQKGVAQGVRVVYTRRINGIFSTSASYAVGNGQKLSEKALTNPANVFENNFFQTFAGQFDADFDTGTQVKTIFRLSPEATVFAIDPFAGRMAIYDPSLSVMVTQSLPTLGLPFRAKAVLDARNLFDFQTGFDSEEGSLKLTSGRRTLRGGISLRF